jgi:hypothetical protein
MEFSLAELLPLVNDPQRESKVTRIIAEHLFDDIIAIAELKLPVLMITEFDKNEYGRQGDVDVACFEIKGQNTSEFILDEPVAFEFKAAYYDEISNSLKSLKIGKHIRQIKNLVNEFWVKAYLADVLIMPPAVTWGHPKTFDAIDMFEKKVEIPECGHVLFIKESVVGRPEGVSGGLSNRLIQSPTKLKPSNMDGLSMATQFAKRVGIQPDGHSYFINDYPQDRNKNERVLRIFQGAEQII